MITLSEFNDLISPLLGMKVTLPWRGYASALFLELGELQPFRYAHQRHQEGEDCIQFEWDWRIENGKQIICGSADSNPEIEKCLSLLIDLKVTGITLDGRVPELTIDLSSGYRLRSMSMSAGYPQWNIRLHDGSYLSFDEGVLIREPGSKEPSEPSSEESEAIVHAEKTAERWGTPVTEPYGGYCRDCTYYFRIDGHFNFLDYGVCTSADSPFDGRAVNVESGCQAFTAD